MGIGWKILVVFGVINILPTVIWLVVLLFSQGWFWKGVVVVLAVALLIGGVVTGARWSARPRDLPATQPEVRQLERTSRRMTSSVPASSCLRARPPSRPAVRCEERVGRTSATLRR